MAGRLELVDNWDQRAKEALFRASILASACRVSRRNLEKFIRRRFGESPHIWMVRLRMAHAALGYAAAQLDAKAESYANVAQVSLDAFDACGAHGLARLADGVEK